MIKNNGLRIYGALVGGVLGGCASVDVPWHSDVLPASPALREAVQACARHYTTLDAAIDRAGVRDAEAQRVRGFPYLRVDRFNASLRDAAAGDPQSRAQWLGHLQALDHAARRVEISNLPDAEVHALTAGGGRGALREETARCAQVLREHDESTPSRQSAIHTRAQAADAYVTAYRVAGAYALTRLPFERGIAQWHRDTLQDFAAAAQPGASAVPMLHYAPLNPSSASPAQIAALLRKAMNNPLRVPRFSAADELFLANAYAPLLAIETGGAYDRIGRLRWDGGESPQPDTATPALYYRIAHTRHHGATLTQIVYTAWFPERPPAHALDLLAGKLDGVVIRVTLGPDGDPLLYDSIHPCGCYHLFIPTARVQPLPAPAGAGEWAFIPATLPAHQAGTRLVLRIATRSHYVNGVSLKPQDATHSYELLPEDGLRTLPAGGATRSAYGPDGLVPGTGRGERFLFWPMGIPSAGAMRQWGHHATAFVGRRHFDDADLIEKRFRIVEP